MKAEELMLGDWVLYDGEPVRIGRISDISPSEEHIMLCNALEGTFPASPERLQPIPITDDILENSGFVHSRCLGLSEHSSKVGQSGTYLYTSTSVREKMAGGYHLTITVDDKDIPEMSITFDMRVFNVHQLQHAMRLAGINKELTIKNRIEHGKESEHRADQGSDTEVKSI